MRKILASDGLSLRDGFTARNEPAMPPRRDEPQRTGFRLPVLRAVMGGRGDAVPDLAKTDLIR